MSAFASRMRRAGALVAVTALLASVQIAAPAAACACGGAAPPLGGEVSVDREIAIVRWDDGPDGTGLEEIVMQLAMSADTGNTGLVVPTPNPATVTLGDAEVFEQLEASIVPEVVVEWDWWGSIGFGGAGGAPDGGGAPVILSQVQLGPVEATTLAADDTAGLQDWLDTNGYALPDAVSAQLGPYVDEGWSFVALKLTSDEPFDGALDPIRFTFESDELVYPMRMSAAATTPQSVRLYLPGDHRSEITDGAGAVVGEPSVVWAGEVEDAAVAELGTYLTVVDLSFEDPPTEITSDLHIGQAPTDDAVTPTRTEHRVLSVLGVPLGWLIVVLVVLLVIGSAVVVGVVLGRRAMRAGAASSVDWPPRP